MDPNHVHSPNYRSDISILIAEDHPLILNGIKQLLTQKWPDASVNTVSTQKDLEILLKKEKFDVLILDLILADGNALPLLQFIKNKNSDLKILVLSAMPEDTFAIRVLQLGADGYLNKKCYEEEVFTAVSSILSGKKYLSEQIRSRLALQSVYGEKKANSPFERLSRREFEIAMLLSSGKSILEISRITSIQSSTVCTHKKNIFSKLHISNIVELNKLSQLHGVVMSL